MKKGLTLVLNLVLLLFLALPVLAAQAQLRYVTDAAALLTAEERSDLEGKATEISDTYQCGVYIITLGDFTEYTWKSDILQAAEEIYRQYSLGWGEQKSGVLLMLSMAERDYALIAYGYGNTAFTDYGKDRLADVFLDDFGEDDWYGGFSDYLEKSEGMLSAARSGNPLDVSSNPAIPTVGVVVDLVLGCLVALVVCFILRGQMGAARQRTEASTYMGSIRFSRREDHFTHATHQRVKIQQPSGGTSGGGTTVNSRGFSGKSGKF